LVAESLTGICGSMPAIIGLCFSYVGDTVAPERRAAVFGLIMGLGAGFGFIAGPMFFARVYADGARLRECVRLVAAFPVLSVLCAAIMPESKCIAERARWSWASLNPLRSFALLFGEVSEQRRVLRLLVTVMSLCFMSKMGLTHSLGIFATQVYDFNAKKRALLMMVYGVFQVLAQLSLPLQLKICSHRLVIVLALVALCVAVAIPAIPSSSSWTIFLAQAFLAVPFTLYSMSTAIAMQVVSQDKTGEASMLISAAFALSTSIGPMFVGALTSASAKATYHGGAFIVLTVIAVATLILGSRLPSDAAIQSLHDAVIPVKSDVENLVFE